MIETEIFTYCVILFQNFTEKDVLFRREALNEIFAIGTAEEETARSAC